MQFQIKHEDKKTRVFIDGEEQRCLTGADLHFVAGQPPRIELRRLVIGDGEILLDEATVKQMSICAHCGSEIIR